MEHKMYKANKQLSAEETLALLKTGDHGTLSVNGDDGYPYATPINYVVVNDKVYMHSAQYGYKIECLQRDAKCCFSAILSQKILPAEMNTAFESVILTGKITFVDEGAEKQAALKAFVTDLCAGYEEVGFRMIQNVAKKTAILRLDATEMTGKAHRG